MLSRVRRDKRGISVVIGYVLLIAISIVMSVLVYQWLRTYVPKEAIKCEEGTSVFLKDVSYDCAASKLTLTIKNNGKFSVDGFFIHISNKSGEDLAAIDISKNIDASQTSYLAGNEIKFSELTANSLSPEGTSNTATFSFNTASYGTIYKVEIIPVRIEVIDSKTRLVSCSDAKVSENLVCKA
jgi:FlaG/FlaF family flagellin (archaellin)